MQEAVQEKGLQDDTTCIVIDMQLPEKPTPTLPPPKKLGKGVFMSMFWKKPSESSSQTEKEYCEPDMVEELFEEGSAMLSERFGQKKSPLLDELETFITKIGKCIKCVSHMLLIPIVALLY